MAAASASDFDEQISVQFGGRHAEAPAFVPDFGVQSLVHTATEETKEKGQFDAVFIPSAGHWEPLEEAIATGPACDARRARR